MEDIDRSKLVLLSELIVMDIMSGGYFEAACAKVHRYIGIVNDRDGSVDKRYEYFFTFQMLIPWVVRMNTKGCIA